MKRDEITPEILRELLTYCPDTGAFRWRARDSKWFPDERKARLWNAQYAGRQALNTVHAEGYLCGKVFDNQVFAHRAAWAMHHGVWPSEQIDHKNGIRDDNRISNLCDVTPVRNRRNSGLHTTNTSGIKGVHWHRRQQKWHARIKVSNRTKHLGYFNRREDAAAAYVEAARAHGFSERHIASAVAAANRAKLAGAQQ